MQSTRCRLGAVRGSGVLEAGAALGGEVRGDCEAQAGQSHLGRGAPVLMRLSVYELRRRCRQPGHDADQEGPGSHSEGEPAKGREAKAATFHPAEGHDKKTGLPRAVAARRASSSDSEAGSATAKWIWNTAASTATPPCGCYACTRRPARTPECNIRGYYPSHSRGPDGYTSPSRQGAQQFVHPLTPSSPMPHDFIPLAAP